MDDKFKIQNHNIKRENIYKRLDYETSSICNGKRQNKAKYR